MRIRRAVLGIDFGAPSIAAAKWAMHHFLPDEGVELLLVHVVPIEEPRRTGRGGRVAAAIVKTTRVGARERLRALADTLDVSPAVDHAHSRVRTAVRFGDPAEQLAEATRRAGADLLVVGKRSVRHGDWSRLGDTADRLATVSPVPVLMVTGPRDVRPRRLLVALDAGADVSLLRWAGQLAERFRARITALHVERTMSRVLVPALAAVTHRGDPEVPYPVASDTWPSESRWLARLRAAGIDPARAAAEVRTGDPTREILAAAERLRSELIVIGQHTDARVRHALLGSVARGVLRGARCPVLLVVEPSDEIADERGDASMTSSRGSEP
jgi:nucleotide-binding universal stress UspA family protein